MPAVRAGKWERTKFVGAQLAGKTLGVVGLGRIGREVARRAAGLDMKVLGFDPVPRPRPRRAARHRNVARSGLTCCRACDFLTVHTPLTDETRNLIGAARAGLDAKGARVINCARGGIINEQALAEALHSGHLAGAALDVFVQEPPPADHPLLKLPNVVVTPHLGASTVEAQDAVAPEAAQLLIDYLTRGVVRFRRQHGRRRSHRAGRNAALRGPGPTPGPVARPDVPGQPSSRAELHYRGEVARREHQADHGGLRRRPARKSALDQNVNIVNARAAGPRTRHRDRRADSARRRAISARCSASTC